MSTSSQLGGSRAVRLEQGLIRYRERGEGEAIVFIHGVFCNGDLWRQVVPPLADDFRCITPDWPLGSHDPPLDRDADLTPPGMARLIASFLEALELENVTLVGNDTGGAYAQLVAADHPERVARLVLLSCDAFENFPPRLLRPSAKLGHLPRLMFLTGQLLRPRAMQRLMFRWSMKRPLPDAVGDSYSRSGLANPGVVRDLGKAMRSMHPRHTLAVAERLGEFDKPALVVWAEEDRFFPPEDGRRLADSLPQATFEQVADSYTFLSEDQPERLATLLRRFLAQFSAASGSSPAERSPA